MKVIFGDLARQLILNQPKNVVDYMVGENPTCLRNITLIDATRYNSATPKYYWSNCQVVTVGRSIIPVLLWHVMTSPNQVSNFDR